MGPLAQEALSRTAPAHTARLGLVRAIEKNKTAVRLGPGLSPASQSAWGQPLPSRRSHCPPPAAVPRRAAHRPREPRSTEGLERPRLPRPPATPRVPGDTLLGAELRREPGGTMPGRPPARRPHHAAPNPRVAPRTGARLPGQTRQRRSSPRPEHPPSPRPRPGPGAPRGLRPPGLPERPDRSRDCPRPHLSHTLSPPNPLPARFPSSWCRGCSRGPATRGDRAPTERDVSPVHAGLGLELGQKVGHAVLLLQKPVEPLSHGRRHGENLRAAARAAPSAGWPQNPVTGAGAGDRRGGRREAGGGRDPRLLTRPPPSAAPPPPPPRPAPPRRGHHTRPGAGPARQRWGRELQRLPAGGPDPASSGLIPPKVDMSDDSCERLAQVALVQKQVVRGRPAPLLLPPAA